MAFHQSDLQKINSLLRLASKGLVGSTGRQIYASDCPCGGTCAGSCTGTSSHDCICQGGCSNAGPTFG